MQMSGKIDGFLETYGTMEIHDIYKNKMTPVHNLCLEVKVPATKGDSLKLPLFSSTWHEVR